MASNGARAKAPLPAFGFEPDDEVELDLTPPALSAGGTKRHAGPVTDLTGKPKIWFLRARGRSGKTLFARWLIEAVEDRDGMMAGVALDQGGRRSLADFVDGVQQPPTADPAGVSRYMEGVIKHVQKHGTSVVVDTGGGDTSIPTLLKTVPDLVEVMRSGGVEPIGVYLLGSAPEDLTVLATDVAAGFAPPCTLLVRNHGIVDPTADPATVFRRVEGHSAFKAAVARGAVVVDMPRLDAATVAKVDGRRLHFRDADQSLDTFDGARVRFWLRAMGESFDPVRTWIPA